MICHVRARYSAGQAGLRSLVADVIRVGSGGYANAIKRRGISKFSSHCLRTNEHPIHVLGADGALLAHLVWRRRLI
jgi:hypothetical protein